MVSKGKEENDSYQLHRLSSMGQIAAGIAHEVKNPLTSVKGFLQLIQEKYSHKYLKIAESELDKALSIIGNFLQVTKPDMDNEPYQEFNTAAELESTLTLFLDRIYQVTVIKEFKDTHVILYGKRNQLKRAFFNLLKNSFESIPGNGTIRIQHYVKEDQLVIVIEDTGIGIDEEKLPLLGTPFLTTKDDGTGLGLPQVYSTVYQHGGRIEVQSQKGKGTRFSIYLPIHNQEETLLNILDVVCDPNQTILDFIEANKDKFRDCLIADQSELTYTLEEIKEISSIDLIANVFNVVRFILNNRPHELVSFAKKEGETWAKHSLKLSFKLEWIQTLRKVFWDFIYNYFRLNNKEHQIEEIFELERKVNFNLDSFLNHFNISYNQFKDELLRTQREMVEDLSVPIIPLTRTVSILPLIGTVDTFRAKTVQEKVLRNIESQQIETLIIDLSGISFLDTAVLSHLFRLFDGVDLMGCKTIVTGIRADVASSLLKLGISIGGNTIKKGNLQQALELIGFKSDSDSVQRN